MAKLVLVLVAFTAFAQWYLPRHQVRLSLSPHSPAFPSLQQLLLEERLHLRERLLNNELEYTTNGQLWDNGMRASRPVEFTVKPHRVLLVGCSCTFGVGVNDNQTYPWKLNEMFPQCAFDNAAVPGYGPYTSLLAMQAYLPKHKYDFVIYASIADHLYRDGFYRVEKISLDKEHRFDYYYLRSYATLKAPAHGQDKPQLVLNPGHCVVWPGDNVLYLISYLKDRALNLNNHLMRRFGELGTYAGYLREQQMTCIRMRLLLDEMAKCAKEYGAGFGFIGLDEIVDTMNSHAVFSAPCEQNRQIDWTSDFSVLDAKYPIDYRDVRELRTKPTAFDDGRHPGERVHDYYADIVASWLQSPEVTKSWSGPGARKYKHNVMRNS